MEPLPLHIEESLVYLLWCFLREVFLLFPTKRNTMERLFIISISAGLSDPGRAGGGGSLSGSVHLCLDCFCMFVMQTHISGRRRMENLYVFF